MVGIGVTAGASPTGGGPVPDDAGGPARRAVAVEVALNAALRVLNGGGLDDLRSQVSFCDPCAESEGAGEGDRLLARNELALAWSESPLE